MGGARGGGGGGTGIPFEPTAMPPWGVVGGAGGGGGIIPPGLEAPGDPTQNVCKIHDINRMKESIHLK